MDQQLAQCFGVAERPVKLLLNAYFRMFSSKDVVKFCRTANINVTKIPRIYMQNGDMATIWDTLPQKFLDHSSIFKIPPKTSDFRINKPATDDADEEIWFLYLDAVPRGQPWSEEQYQRFGEKGSKAVKQLIGNTVKMTMVVFETLKSLNKELMETLTLEVNKENVTLELRDSRYPQLQCSVAIGPMLRQPAPGEDVPPVLGTL